jgi:hypothetical protein
MIYKGYTSLGGFKHLSDQLWYHLTADAGRCQLTRDILVGGLRMQEQSMIYAHNVTANDEGSAKEQDLEWTQPCGT